MTLTAVETATWAIEMAIKHGIPAVQAMIATWNDETEVTQETIKELEASMRKPEAYFEE